MRKFVLLCVVMLLLGCQGSAPCVKSNIHHNDALTSNPYYVLVSKFWEERARLTSKPSFGGDVAVGDLHHILEPLGPNSIGISALPPERYSLVWSYRNVGDYDWDGEVSVADITQVADFFGYTAPDGQTPSYKLKADGDGNGEVGVSDITPIAYNYLSAVSGYIIQGSQLDGEFTDIVQIDDEALGVQIFHGWHKTISWDCTGQEYDLFRVVPVDLNGQRSSPSNIAGSVWIQPNILSVSPTWVWSGGGEPSYVGQEITFSVELSEESVPPFAYDWDFGGASVPNTSTEQQVMVNMTEIGEFWIHISVSNQWGTDSWSFPVVVNPV